MLKLNKQMRDELDAKGVAQLALEATALIGFLGLSYGALFLLAEFGGY